MHTRKELGVAVIGSGRIGTLRATMAAAHPAVRYLAVSDRDPARAKALAERVGAQFHAGSNYEAISRPEVNAVIVSTLEIEHSEPVMQALELGKPVLVEKPIAIKLEEADRLIAAAARSKGSLHVGYSRRFKKRYLLAKEQIVQGRLGRITGTAARVYNSRSQAMQTLKRMPADSNPVSGLTYYIDLLNWLLDGNGVVEVVARGQRGVIQESGYGAPDVVGVLLTYADGAISNLGVSYALPPQVPRVGACSARRDTRNRRRDAPRRRSHRSAHVQRAGRRPRLHSRAIAQTWCFWAAERPATGRWAIFTDRSQPKAATGSITSPWGGRAFSPRRRTRAESSRSRWQSNAHFAHGKLSNCRSQLRPQASG